MGSYPSLSFPFSSFSSPHNTICQRKHKSRLVHPFVEYLS
jgi:hypothetical protein